MYDKIRMHLILYMGDLPMKTKKLSFLLSLAFLFLFSGSVYSDDFQKSLRSYIRKEVEAAKALSSVIKEGLSETKDGLGAIYKIGKELLNATAVELLRLAAENGDAETQFNLGVLYDNGGQGVPQDYKEAIKWYRLAADQGDADAQFNLGVFYHFGEGVPQDYKEAVKWYRLAADQGLALAQFKLGLLYDNGQGVPQDYKEAVKWYRLAADQGIVRAQFNLAWMYGLGQGVIQDYKEAAKWFRLAVKNRFGELGFFKKD